MGFVSYLEDIQESIDQGLFLLRQEPGSVVPVAASMSPEQLTYKRQLESIFLKAQANIRVLMQYLDLATDPAVNVAAELAELRSKYTEIETQNRELKLQLDRERTAARQRETHLQQLLEQEKMHRKKAEDRARWHDHQLATDPAAFERAIDRTMTDEQIRQAKPGEPSTQRKRTKR